MWTHDGSAISAHYFVSRLMSEYQFDFSMYYDKKLRQLYMSFDGMLPIRSIYHIYQSHLSTYLSIHLSIHQFYLPFYLYFCLSTFLCIYLSINSIYVSIHLSIFLLIHLTMYLSIFHILTVPSIYSSIYLNVLEQMISSYNPTLFLYLPHLSINHIYL